MHEVSLFEAILNTNIINFLIVLSTLVWIFKKFNLGQLIDKMALDVKEKVEKSALDTKEAIKEYKTVKKETANTPKLQEEIIKKAQIEAQNLKENIEKTTQLKEQEIISTIEKNHQTLVEKFKKAATNEIYLSCINIAQDEVIKRLDETNHKKIINSSIDELDKIESISL